MAEGGYILLRRRFCPVGQEPSTGLSRRILGENVGETWDSLVPTAQPPDERSAVVVLSPSGVGKTAELKARATQLRDAGVPAFFMRAVDVAVSGVIGAIQEQAALGTWKGTTTRAVFFVDAVDEARLEGHDLERVLARFAQDVDPATRRVQLVLSSRNDIWAIEDVRHLVRTLALPTEKPAVRVVRLEPLSLEDVKLFAKASGMENADAFISSFVEDELDQLFDLRPPDARVLVDYWNQHGMFGNWSEMLETSIEASVRNENRRHALQQQFTLEEARSGLARLGAATVLGKRPIISMPGTSHPGEVSAERLFADRRPASTSQLLAMGLFAQKGLHSVQLPQGAPSHFLAASWLGERARRGWDPRALEALLFITPFDCGRTLTPPSRSPVVGWVASTVPVLRKRLLKDLPHVLLFEGDPSKLSRGECIEALRAVLAQMRSAGHDVSATRGTLRQIAKHDIRDAVLRLLHEFAGTPRAERVLLRIAELGRYPIIASAALALALAPGVDDSVGGAAIRVVATVGTDEQRAQLLSLTGHPSEWIRLALVQSLSPTTLSGASLVQLVLGTTGREVSYFLSDVLTRVSLSDIDAILMAIEPTLASSTVATGTEAYLKVASRLAVARLTRGGAEVPKYMPALLLAIESHLTGPFFVSHDVAGSLEALVEARTDLRRAVWEARITRATNPDGIGRLLSPKLGPARAEDFEWLWAKRESAADESLKNALGWPLGEALRRMPAADRAELLGSRSISPELKASIDLSVAASVHADARHREAEAQQAAERAALRAKNIAEVRPMLAEIEAGQNPRALLWAWQHLTGTDTRQSRLGTGGLVEAVGSDMAEVFMTGFQRWWRRHEPELPQPGGNSIPLLNLAGLTGLSLEIERGLDLAKLTDADVERAARYALYELNGFPVWFDALRATHPANVRALLEKVVRAEWSAGVEHHGVISRAPYEALGTAELVRELVISELEQGPPGHARTAHYAIGALLLPTRPNREVAGTLERRVSAAADGDIPILAEWLRGWSYFAPESAAAWLRRLAGDDEARFLAVIEQVASLLEEDFDERSRAVAPGAWSPSALEAWVRLLHIAVRPEEDVSHPDGVVYHPGRRDRAQEFRSRCVSRLARDPSRQAFESLRRIRNSTEMKPYRAMVDRLVFAQLTTAAEDLATPWTEEDILRVERGDERAPKSNADLFALVRRHLARVADLLENDDFSYAALFSESTSEKEVQAWIASSLMLVSRGLYTVEREPEVQDDKLMDISVTVPGIGRVPVEVKPLYASRYTYSQLKAFVSEQLVGRYMRPAAIDRGIFLVVPLKSRTWRVNRRVVSFDELLLKLAAHAKKIGAKAYKEVVVASINVAAARASKMEAVVRKGPARLQDA